MMYEAEYIEAGEPTPSLTGEWRHRLAEVAQHEVTEPYPRLSFEEALRQFLALGESQRQAGTGRSSDPGAAFDPQQSLTQPAASNNHPQSSSNHPPAEPAADGDWQLELAFVKQRAAELFPGGTATPALKPRRPALVEKPTNELAMLVFDASKGIAIIRGQLAREEVAGYLAADLLGIELLKEEALRLGESVRKAAAAAKDGDAKLRNATAALKSKLKQKALKDPEIAADLPCKLQRLDSGLDTARAQLKQEPSKLNGLPDAKSVIVERKPKPALTICRGCTRSTRSGEAPTPLQLRFGRLCACVWGPDEAFLEEDPQPTSKGAVSRARAEWEQWRTIPETGMAIALIDQLENLYHWLEDGEPVTQEQIDAQTQQCQLAVRRLEAAIPDSLLSGDDRALAFGLPRPCMADERNSIPCPYGFGRIARWPWAFMHLEPLGFCGIECRCEIVRNARVVVVKMTLGAWPDDVHIRKIW